VSSSAARRDLDLMVINIELTLTSIIQGVALYFLAENAHQTLSIQKIASWPYAVAGLLIIFVFWSRSILHTLTLIRWPLELVHNFIYIACALGEAMLFTHLGNPRAWFALSTLFAAGVWALFVFDLRMISARLSHRSDEALVRLCAAVRRDQWLNIGWLVPGLFLLNAACLICINRRPDFFIDGKAHVYLVVAQAVVLLIYLAYVVRLFARLAPLIRATREEWYATLPERPGAPK
jgi:hypothetical protein